MMQAWADYLDGLRAAASPQPVPAADAAADLADALTKLGVTELAGVPPVQCAPGDAGCQAEAILFVAVDVAGCENVPASESALACVGQWVTINQFPITPGPINLIRESAGPNSRRTR